MKPHPRVSPAGLELIKRFEGLRRRSARLPDGGWTIGYGHTRSAREGVEVTEEEAEALLIYDLSKVSEAFDAWCFTPLNQNQVDALAAFAFNIGLDAFRTSHVLRWINEGLTLQAAAALEMWRKADFEGESLVFDALVRRRAAEKALFLTPVEGFQPAPSPVLRPTSDPTAVDAAGRSRATAVRPALTTASLVGDRTELTVERPPQDDAEPDSAEPPPSPTELAAANLAERLNRLLEREPPVAAGAAESEIAAQQDAAESPPRPSLADTPQLSDQPDPFSQPVEGDDAFTGPFGRRAPSPDAPPALPKVDSYTSRIFILGVLGLAMVLGSLVAMLVQRASLTSLIIGLVGVICLAPAAARFVTVRLEHREARRIQRG